MKRFALLSALATLIALPASADESLFSKPTIDFGVVVSDLNASIKWYEDVVGFQKAQAFQVSGQIAQDAGLSDGSARCMTGTATATTASSARNQMPLPPMARISTPLIMFPPPCP